MHFVSTVELVTTATVIEASGFAADNGGAEKPIEHGAEYNE
jgi:hypothetical protein